MTRADRILTHEDWQRLSLRDFIGEELGKRGFGPPPTTASAVGQVIAYVNHGRWVADCPAGDGGALCVSMKDPFFMCPYCANEDNAGQWYRVRFPARATRERLEHALLVRPAKNGFEATTRNWRPGETDADLRRENRRMNLRDD